MTRRGEGKEQADFPERPASRAEPHASFSMTPEDPHDPVQHAAFSIFFDRDDETGTWQTRIYREEGEGQVAILDGIDPVQWVHHIFREAELPPESLVGEDELRLAAAASSRTDAPLALRAIEIRDVAVAESRSTTRPHEPWVSVDVTFDVTHAVTGRDDTGDLAYLAETLVVDREGGRLRTVVSHYDNLKRGVATYRAHTELPMPPVGRYGIETVVLLFPPVEAVTCRRGPLLIVNP